MRRKADRIPPSFIQYTAEAAKLAGSAHTVRGGMAPYDGSGDALKMWAYQGVSSGVISIWSGDGEGVCYFGELIALDAGTWLRRRIDRWRHSGHPLDFRTHVQSIGRWKVVAWQEPVYMRGATANRVTIWRFHSRR